jgi:hypothetical protein
MNSNINDTEMNVKSNNILGLYRALVHKFSKNPCATSKLHVPEGWHEASSKMRIHKY